jgi:hypothetical protein
MGTPMIDQWNEVLRCPQCNNTGIASLSQFAEAPIPTVDSAPVGFMVVQSEYGPGFHCAACNIPAEP